MRVNPVVVHEYTCLASHDQPSLTYPHSLFRPHSGPWYTQRNKPACQIRQSRTCHATLYGWMSNEHNVTALAEHAAHTAHIARSHSSVLRKQVSPKAGPSCQSRAPASPRHFHVDLLVEVDPGYSRLWQGRSICLFGIKVSSPISMKGEVARGEDECKAAEPCATPMSILPADPGNETILCSCLRRGTLAMKPTATYSRVRAHH
jgi:hypothetical protein